MAYTTIDHDVRKSLNLTLNEYAICDSIYYLSRGGICTASKEYLGEFIGISKQAVHKILNKLEKIELITRNKNGIKTTDKWNYEVLKSHGVNKVYDETVKKVYPDSKESLPETVNKVYPDSKESLPNNNSNNNLDIYNIILKSVIDTWLDCDNTIKHNENTIISNIKKKHKDKLKEYPLPIIQKAIKNYSKIIGSEKFYFNHSWLFWDFIMRGLDKFVDSSKPFENYRIKEYSSNSQEKPIQYAPSIKDRESGKMMIPEE